jgi:hypothetical protein
MYLSRQSECAGQRSASVNDIPDTAASDNETLTLKVTDANPRLSWRISRTEVV